MTILREPHCGKKIKIEVDGITYFRYPIKVPVVMPGDNLIEILKEEVRREIKSGDLVLVAESALSAAQGRVILIDDIRPGKFAKFLTKYMTKTDAGIGASDPLTMQIVIQEVGHCRIFLAAAVAAVTKPLGISGMFYRVAGEEARGVDGPADYVIPPYNRYVVRSPKNPGEWAQKAGKSLGADIKVIVIDANDLGINILEAQSKEDEKLALQLAFDNPLGQGSESTPFLFCKKEFFS